MNFRPVVSCPRQSFASAPRTKIGTRKASGRSLLLGFVPTEIAPQRRPSPRFQPPSEPRARPGDHKKKRAPHGIAARVPPARYVLQSRRTGGGAHKPSSARSCGQYRRMLNRNGPSEAGALSQFARLRSPGSRRWMYTSSEPSALYFRPSVLRSCSGWRDWRRSHAGCCRRAATRTRWPAAAGPSRSAARSPRPNSACAPWNQRP